MSIGIYKILNKTKNKCYIGCSKNIEDRWKQHLTLLRTNKHHSVKLQNAWNKYKENNFEFSIIEECEVEELFIKENYHIYDNDSLLKGYNMVGGTSKIIQSMDKSCKYYLDFKPFVDSFVMYCEKIEKLIESTPCYKYRYYDIHLTNDNKTPNKYIKFLSMFTEMIKVISSNGDINNGIFFNGINYFNNGKFNYDVLEYKDNKWYRDGKVTSNHKIWKSEYKECLQDFIYHLYWSKHKKLLCFYPSLVKYLEEDCYKEIAKYINNNKIILEKIEIDVGGSYTYTM